jgi:hypothetical protein
MDDFYLYDELSKDEPGLDMQVLGDGSIYVRTIPNDGSGGRSQNITQDEDGTIHVSRPIEHMPPASAGY